MLVRRLECKIWEPAVWYYLAVWRLSKLSGGTPKYPRIWQLECWACGDWFRTRNDTVPAKECSQQAVDRRQEEYRRHQPRHLQPSQHVSEYQQCCVRSGLTWRQNFIGPQTKQSIDEALRNTSMTLLYWSMASKNRRIRVRFINSLRRPCSALSLKVNTSALFQETWDN